MNRTAALAIAGIRVLAVLPGVASGSIPAPDGTYTACYQKKSGSLKLIDAGKRICSPGTEVQVTWNQMAPGSPAGTSGAYGAAVSAPDRITGCYQIIVVDQVGTPMAGEVVTVCK